jgi:hypothetical protein
MWQKDRKQQYCCTHQRIYLYATYAEKDTDYLLLPWKQSFNPAFSATRKVGSVPMQQASKPHL